MKGCQTSYRNNYSVRDGKREYYGAIPDYIQVADHFFIERRVIDGFIAHMLHSWTSATNCAAIYNSLASSIASGRENWPFTFRMRTEHVWDGFVILALLESCLNTPDSPPLVVPHEGDQKERFTVAMKLRNAEMRVLGQPELLHACTKCMHTQKDPQTGKMSA